MQIIIVNHKFQGLVTYTFELMLKNQSSDLNLTVLCLILQQEFCHYF